MNLLVAWLIFKQALDAHEDVVLHSHILRQLLTVLDIELAYKAFDNPVYVFAHLTLSQDEVTLLESHGNEDALQYIQLFMSHRTVASGQFAGHITCR